MSPALAFNQICLLLSGLAFGRSRYVQAENFGAAVMDSWITPTSKGARSIRIEMNLDGEGCGNGEKRMEKRIEIRRIAPKL